MKRKRKSRAAVWLALFMALVVGGGASAQESEDASFEQTAAPEVDLSASEGGGTDEEQQSAPGEPAQFRPGFLDEFKEAYGGGGETGADDSSGDADATSNDLKKSAIKAVAALCVVVALILLCTYGFRRLGPRNPLLAGPSFGNVVGRVFLAPRTCLYLVRMGGRILVVGVTNNAIAPIAEFDAAELENDSEQSEEDETDDAQRRVGFLEHLLARRARIQEPEEKTEPDDGDLKALREDIQRLQDQLRSVSGALDE